VQSPKIFSLEGDWARLPKADALEAGIQSDTRQHNIKLHDAGQLNLRLHYIG
jgi:hypothetical protein